MIDLFASDNRYQRQTKRSFEIYFTVVRLRIIEWKECIGLFEAYLRNMYTSVLILLICNNISRIKRTVNS